THIMMSDFPESSLRHRSNAAIQTSSGPMRDSTSDGVGDTRWTANLLRNNVDPSPHPLVVVERTIDSINRETILSA
ncbi:hypothetical protein HAX54_007450, partial [Datura stramonium]|nr:hypothetical protein [Datura stramonium]